jgi:hypothetical protein
MALHGGPNLVVKDVGSGKFRLSLSEPLFEVRGHDPSHAEGTAGPLSVKEPESLIPIILDRYFLVRVARTALLAGVRLVVSIHTVRVGTHDDVVVVVTLCIEVSFVALCFS